MNFNDIKAQLPDYAKDLRLNLDSLLAETGTPGLSSKQMALIALASAIASRHAPLTEACAVHASDHASEEEINGMRAAAAIMGMNNIYYRFSHLVSNPDYQTLRPALRMNVIANPGGDKLDFELASMAVSAINGCGACMDSHEKTLRKHEIPALAVQSAVRIAAVIHAIAVVHEQAQAASGTASAG